MAKASKDEINVTTDTIIMAKPGIVLQEEPDNWGILYNPGTDFSFAVDPVSAFTWKNIKNKTSVNDICTRVCEHFTHDCEYTDEDIIEFIRMLLEKGLATTVPMMSGKEKIKDKEDLIIDYPLEKVYFYLTEGCNLACRHCWINPKLQNENNIYPSLPVDIFRSILEQAVPLGLNSVKLTGGEPLMHPEISTILKIIRDHGLNLSMETNGVLCTPGLAKEIAAGKRVSISVSLDGPDARGHEWVRGIEGCFDAALEGINNLVEAGIKPQIIMAVMRSNRDRLEQMAGLAESLGAGSVKFTLFHPTGRGEILNEKEEALTLKESLALGEWITNTLSASTKLKLIYTVPPAFQSLSYLFGENGGGGNMCGVLEIIGVLANGNYALCGIGTHVPGLVFGNAATDRLQDIWKNNKVLLELREGIPSRFEGICGRCHLNRFCSGICIAQNYYSTKSLWKSFWMCEQAYQAGIFPGTRMKPG